MTTRLRLQACAYALFLVTGAGAARADRDDREQVARLAYERAAAAYDRGDLEAALSGFVASYAALPRARTLWNSVVTLRALGRYVDAANALERYLVALDSDPQRAAQARNWLSAFDAKLARVSLPDDRELLQIDGRGVDVPDGVTVLRLEPGRHEITMGSHRWYVELEPGSVTALELPGHKPGLRREQRQHTDRRWVTPAVLTGLAGAVALGAGVWTLETENDLAMLRARPQPDANQIDATRSQGRRLAFITNVSLGATAVAAATTLYFLATRERAEAASPALGVQVDRATGGIALSWSRPW
jgi:hypothetical protein